MPPSWHPAPACTPRLCCRRAVLRCSSDGAAAILKSGLEIKNRCSLWAILEGFLASILKSGPEIKNRCTLEGVSGETPASIRKSGPEIKNRCSLWVILEGFLAAIPKSGPEIKNHCTLEGVSWQKPAVIAKSELEFKNRCSRCLVAVCRRNRSSSRQRRIEQTRTSSLLRLLQAEPFSFAATKNRIGRGRSLPQRLLQAGHSPLRQRKLESEADLVAATAVAGETILLCRYEN